MWRDYFCPGVFRRKLDFLTRTFYLSQNEPISFWNFNWCSLCGFLLKQTSTINFNLAFHSGCYILSHHSYCSPIAEICDNKFPFNSSNRNFSTLQQFLLIESISQKVASHLSLLHWLVFEEFFYRVFCSSKIFSPNAPEKNR